MLSAQAGHGEPSTVRVALRAGVKPTLTLGLERLEDGAFLHVSVHDGRGHALPGEPVHLRASLGEVGPVQDQGDGTYLVRYRSPPAGGEVRFDAWVDGAPPVSRTETLEAIARLTLELTGWAGNGHELPADGLSRVSLRISARDAKGFLAPDGTKLLLSTTLGRLPASVTTREGRATVELESVRQTGEALVQVRWEDQSVSTTVRLVPGEPARLRVRTEKDQVLCDGRDSTQVYLLVEDLYGNPLDGVPITLRAAGIRAEADTRNEKINYKVREHSVAKVPAILAIGMKEVEDRTVSVRRLDQQGSRLLPLADAVAMLKDEATPPDLR